MAVRHFTLRFGPFEANPLTGELRKQGTRIKLASQSFQVLVLLAERAGDLVSREDIRAELWPNETVVEWEHSINTAIQRIRAALNDSATEPRYVETLPRRGYRFLAPVERTSSAIPAPPSPRVDASDPLGKTLSHYRVLALLGSGGMGVVYRGEDVLLGRPVALKFLRPELASDPVSVERFQREARAASSLNHPNICTIYEVETVGGRAFLAMELLEGKTLRERIAKSPTEGMLPRTMLVETGIAIADALEAAHGSGMIHRDITPANVFLTRSGAVKVLDFGLAKVAPRRSLPEASVDSLTSAGAAPGTLAYMSPEQRRGEELDGRTDLYSMGAVLYEAATGWPLSGDFRGSALTGEMLDRYPSRFWEIVERLVDPDPALRYQTAGDAASDLRRLRRDLSSNQSVEAPVRRPAARRYRASIIAAGAVAVASAAFGLFLMRQQAKPIGEMTIQPLTGMSGQEDDPAFAPDGKLVAYSSQAEEETAAHIYVKLIRGGPPIALTSGPAMDYSPAWSPDGRTIGFIRNLNGEQVCVIPAFGGAVRGVAYLQPAAPDRGSRTLSWLPNSADLLVSDRGSTGEPPAIFLLSSNTGARRKVTVPPPDAFGDGSPEVSPDGKSFAFLRWARNSVSDIYVQPLSGGVPRRLTLDGSRISSFAWTSDGSSIVFQSTRGGLTSLWKVPLQGGAPQPISGIGGDAAAPAIARQGNLLAYVYQFENVNLWRIPGPGASPAKSKPTNLSSSPREDISGDYSPDGQRIAFSSNRSGSFEIWVSASDGSHPQQLTFFRGPITGTPHWSPDSRSITFDSRPKGHGEIFVIGREGGQPRPATNDPYDDIVPNWSRDGKFIYFCSNRGHGEQIYRIPASGGESVQITRNGGFDSVESPDRSWLYYSKLSAAGVWRMPLAGGDEEQVLNQFTSRFWTLTPGGLAYLDAGAKSRSPLNVMDLSTRRIRRIGTMEGRIAWGYSGFSVSPGGEWLLYAQMDRLVSQINLVENFR